MHFYHRQYTTWIYMILQYSTCTKQRPAPPRMLQLND